MAEEEGQLVTLRTDFYRDSFGKIIFIIASILAAMTLLIIISLYLYFNQPSPVLFSVDNEWRVQPPVPLDQPYLSKPDLLQWVSNVLPAAFRFDFIHYNDQLKTASQYFTADGWKVFLNQLNNYANYNNVQNEKLFINGVASSAPYVVNQGIFSGRYAWWVQMPIDLNYETYNRKYTRGLMLQVLVVRVPTSNNLSGVGINNVIVVSATEG